MIVQVYDVVNDVFSDYSPSKRNRGYNANTQYVSNKPGMPRRSDEVEENILRRVIIHIINIFQTTKQQHLELKRINSLWEQSKREINEKNKEIQSLKDGKTARRQNQIQTLENTIADLQNQIEDYVYRIYVI